MADPITRQEIYLAYIAGEYSGELPTPVTREEQYLYNIAVNGTGSTVEVTQIKETGEKIATITVDGEATDIYASAGGGGGGAVDTVNGMTGDVVLTASDVGALPDDTNIPTKTSDLTNDSNFVSDADYVHTDNNYTTAEKTAVGTISSKADKVASATSGNFAGLDEYGNLTDSGSKASDFLTQHQDISGKQDKTLTSSVKIGTETETTVEGAIGEVAAIIPATAAVSNKLSTAADTAKEDITATANSEDIALTDAADARVHDLKIYGKTVDGHSVGENGLTVTACGKNILHIGDDVVSRQYWGVTFTITRNSNGDVTEITANGTASQSLWFELINDTSKSFPQGSYITGCPANGNINTYSIGVYHSIASGISEAYVYDTGNGGVISEVTDCQRISIVIRSGVTVNNLKFYPMVRIAGTNTFEPYKSNTLTLTSALPLRGNGDVKDEIDLADGIAITRLDSNGDVLATPVTTPLSDAEKAAFAEFRTFDDNTNVTATDDPFMSLTYVKNTDNGKAVAEVDDRVDSKVDKVTGKQLSTEDYTTAEKTKLSGIATSATANTVIDTTCTLTVAGWTGADVPYTQTVNVTGLLSTDKPILDLSVSSTVATGVDEIDDWALISKAESGAGTLTFSCYEDKPTTELNVNVKVVR